MAELPPEACPFRLRVLNAITALLAAIVETDGYSVTLGVAEDAPDGRVFRGRAAYGENDPLPMVSILEDPRNLQQDMAPAGVPASQGDWNLLIQVFVEDDLVHPTDPAYFVLADVKRKLIEARAATRNILGFGHKSPCVVDIKLGAGVVRPADEISAKAYGWLPVTLALVENHENPFT